MRQGLVFVVAAMALTGQAMATDLPPRAAPPPPVVAPSIIQPAPVFTWTGFYLGAQAGYAWDGSKVYTATWSQGVGRSGGFGGVVAGYNYQINQFVIGVQGEYNFSNFKGSANGVYAPKNFTVDTKISSFGSIDGRVGYAYDRFLIYAIGGVAFANPHHSVTFSTPIVEQDNFSGNRTGYDVGYGLEYAFQNNWSVRGEFRYYNFGSKDFAALGMVTPSSTKETFSSVRLGAVYLFH